MDSRKISTGIPNIISVSSGITTKSTDKDSQNQQQQNSPQKESKRQPTEEEAQRAIAILSAMESVAKNALQLELINEEGIFIIFVRDSHGQVLRGLRGMDIFRLLDTKVDKSSTSTRGSILDSRM